MGEIKVVFLMGEIPLALGFGWSLDLHFPGWIGLGVRQTIKEENAILRLENQQWLCGEVHVLGVI